MKIFKVTYKVADRFNPEYNEIKTMSISEKSEVKATERVRKVVYAITEFTNPTVNILEVK